MTMNRIKMLKLIASFAMAMLLCLSIATPALMADNYSKGTELEPAQAKITKVLTMADGTVTPVETFTFTMTSKKVNDETATSTNMPVIGSKTIGFTAADTGSVESGVKSVIKETTDDIFKDVDWPHAGVYIYTVEEEEGDMTGMTYSEAVYDVYVYVANGVNGLYVAGIGAYLMVDQDGEEADEEKVDPTPGDPLIPGDHSEMIFNNTFIKQGGGDPTNPADHMLNISKTVAGFAAGNDYGDRTKYFSFSLTVNKPATVDGSVTYFAYVVAPKSGGGLEVVTNEFNYASALVTDQYGKYIPVVAGTPITILLKHGQQLVFTNLHYGSSYIATEAAVTDYTAKVDVVVNGAAPVTLSNASHQTARSTAPNETPGLERVIGEGVNSAAFTNTYKSVTPTGINIDNLPFIVLIAVVSAALVIALLIKHRSKEKKA